MKRLAGSLVFFLLLLSLSSCEKSEHALVLQSDFGEKDGAVSAMRGVANSVSNSLQIFDLTHEIPAYNIWEASYRLGQTAKYWAKGTVFVSVVDPGVGTNRKSVVLKTKSGHYFVTPDNGTLTHVSQQLGIDEVREIDEVKNRLANSEESYTFHGRDVYAYTGARLASKTISFSEVGPILEHKVVNIPYQIAEIEDGMLYGGIPVLDPQYGNVWTNISKDLLVEFTDGNIKDINVTFFNSDDVIATMIIPFKNTFGDVAEGAELAYLNSLNQLSFALNMSNFAEKHRIKSGENWRVVISK